MAFNKSLFSTVNSLNDLLKSSTNNFELLNGIAKVASQAADAKAVLMTPTGKIIAGNENVPVSLKSRHSDDDSDSDTWFMNTNTFNQIDKLTESKCDIDLNGFENYSSAVFPVQSGGSLLLFKEKDKGEFSEDDKITAALCANNAAIINQQEQYENAANEKRELQIAHDVLNSLSFTEIDVIAEVFECIKDGEGFVIASKIADKNGYARSVTVNALRKLESAGVINTRSLGVKGTYIKVLNKRLCAEIKKFRKKKSNY